MLFLFLFFFFFWGGGTREELRFGIWVACWVEMEFVREGGGNGWLDGLGFGSFGLDFWFGLLVCLFGWVFLGGERVGLGKGEEKGGGGNFVDFLMEGGGFEDGRGGREGGLGMRGEGSEVEKYC